MSSSFPACLFQLLSSSALYSRLNSHTRASPIDASNYCKNKWQVYKQTLPCSQASVWPRQPRTAANSHNAHPTSRKASILRQVWVPGGELERLDGGQTKAARGRRGALCWMHKPQQKSQCSVTPCS